ncbi:prepilin peptidase [Providencia sp. wls1943]|uniref:prepilin peptidase n=1 Tax=Providencia sp. wls1943 TaxID=2675150 RepID=UPI0012B630E7|nr:A24 family peptidase [Providencia sp. wls1943]MTB67495.1 prepilin peptidase [Providencia sp. wls1943]
MIDAVNGFLIPISLVTLLSLLSSWLTTLLLREIPARYFDLPSITINVNRVWIGYWVLGAMIALLGYPLFVISVLFLFFNLVIPLGVIDLKTGYLPNVLNYPLLVLGLLFQWIMPAGNLLSAIYALIFSYVGLVVITTLVEKIRRRPQMGRGDFKLIAACATWLGLFYLPYFLGLAASLGLLHFLWRAWREKQEWQGKHKLVKSIPFGPAIICSASFWLMFSWYPN